jgi:DNA-binding MarR family transcriptional regulator
MTDDTPPFASSPSAHAEVHFYQPGTHTAEASFGYTMRRIMTLLAQDIERLMEPHGLTNAQWMPLMKLYFGQARTVAELARECAMDAGAMTRLLDRLEAKGLCQRQRSSEDRRVVNLVLTEAGLTAAQNIPAELCQAQNACLRGFSTDEWQTLMGLLHRILTNAQNAVAATVPNTSTDNAPPL